MIIQAGDYVRRKPTFRDHGFWPHGNRIMLVHSTTDDSINLNDGWGTWWDASDFDRVSSPTLEYRVQDEFFATYEEALAQAQSLADQYPGQSFTVFKAVAKATR